MALAAVAQFSPSVDISKNLLRIRAFAEQAAQKGAEILVLPELSNTGYDMKLFPASLPSEQEAIAELQEIARKSNVVLAAGLAVRTPSGEQQNISAIVGHEGLLHRYAKAHLFDLGSNRESDFFQPGDTFSILKWNEWNVAPLVCFDLRFPELARQGALEGATLFVSHSAWPHARRDVYQTLARARAIENQVYALHSNFVGNNASGDRFAGSSCIVAPDGKILAQLDDQEEGLTLAELDLNLVINTRKILPCLPKRRVDIY